MIGPSLGRTEVVRRLRGEDAITIRAAIHEVRTDTQHGDGPRAVFGEAKIWTRAELKPTMSSSGTRGGTRSSDRATWAGSTSASCGGSMGRVGWWRRDLALAVGLWTPRNASG